MKRPDPECLHCLGVGHFGGALFGGARACYCVSPAKCVRCGGSGMQEKPYCECQRCYATGKEAILLVKKD